MQSPCGLCPTPRYDTTCCDVVGAGCFGRSAKTRREITVLVPPCGAKCADCHAPEFTFRLNATTLLVSTRKASR
jgi:hypothetical protein